ncbi:MAG TPA: hypothetical protein VGQ36_27695 [Thermoanaerobaculia bacterium]|jgi:hypothetical protein|nr:hypothetical protein [Thermoanaerobaculia bacterium]
MIVSFWALAAFLVFETHQLLAPIPALGVALGKIVVIVAVAWAYMRLASPAATLDHALLVGIVWFALGIGAEIAMTFNAHHAWFFLLGSPASSALRAVMLAAWVGTPALFARNRS